MEEIQSCTDTNRSSSSSSSPASANPLPSTSYFFLRKPGSGPQLRSVEFEDSPEWEDEDDVEADIEEEGEGGGGAGEAAEPSASAHLPKHGNASSQSVDALQPNKAGGATLVWKDLTITMPGKRKYSDKVIKSSTGYALPGTLTVIMGPAKSGKSTLLRTLAGLAPTSAKVYGNVLVNGRKSKLEYGSYGYVERADQLIELLTVREMLYYSALLQLPEIIPYKKADIVEETILAMSLEDYADRHIGGNCYCKGLARGERRRLSIARELLTSPYILFIDEPLYHLDSVSALLMMVTLKKLTSTGCTIVFTMYQSSTEVFGLFDRICLLSNGRELFFGETLACLQHFANAGFPCPVMQSPSDHFLRAINTDFDRIIAMCKNWQDDQGDFSSVNMDTAVAIQTLETTYEASTDAASVEAMVVDLTKKEGPILEGQGNARTLTRIAVLTWRSSLIMFRDIRYFWLRLLLFILLMICMGTAFSNIGHSLYSIGVRVAAVFFFVAFTSLMSIGGFPAHIREIKVFMHEKSNRHTGAFVFSLGNLFACLQMVVASVLPQLFKGIITIVFLQGIMMLAAGYFRLREELPRPVWKYPLSYLAFHTYAIEGLLENEYTGTSFAVGQIRSIPGDQAVHDSYNISSSRNAKWLNLLILAVIAIGYRIILFFSLHFEVRRKALSIKYCKQDK
ncbi:ABC transporter G family member 3 isoform X2 [Cryptomeria japonica]|uniref:ABC transporter G family member 3 isoform X2 n=1 Tax=Cryptomeria japonica TaxID=3369 RepID=UPI0025AC0763|nr:ABC transporter G family member 3 isoform X2 [Cryptomeria japonica]